MLRFKSLILIYSIIILFNYHSFPTVANNTVIDVANIPLIKQIIPLPDIELGETSKGFTGTGLTYDREEDVFWIGNCGKNHPSDEIFYATIVKVSKDSGTILGEIKLYDIFPYMSDVQGVTIDESNNTIWFCSFAENKIRHISKSGHIISSFDINRPIGIAYSRISDTLWVLTKSELINIEKDGAIIESLNFDIDGQDQLFLDEVNNIIYLTAGSSYYSDSYVYKIDLFKKEIDLAFILKESFAVKGIYIEDDKMYILNDGYYHQAKIPVNQINKYDISNFMSIGFKQ